MATLIKTDGSVESVNPPKGKKTFPLETLQKAVGGYIELVRLPCMYADAVPRMSFLVVNEEGKLMNLPPNPRATAIIRAHGYNDYIVGDALLCNPGEID